MAETDGKIKRPKLLIDRNGFLSLIPSHNCVATKIFESNSDSLPRKLLHLTNHYRIYRSCQW